MIIYTNDLLFGCMGRRRRFGEDLGSESGMTA